jgi:hypothetical protein
MLKYLFIIPFVCISSFLSAQLENGQYIHRHLVRADASIVPGYIFKDNLKNIHLNGNLEYYLDHKISIRGDANYMLGSSGLTEDSMHLQDNISIMLGSVLHFPTNSHFDPYFILQPGIAYTSSYYDPTGGNVLQDEADGKIYRYKGSLSPLASVGLGFNYYFQRFAHLFLETRYVYGQHLSSAPSPVSLEELRITFGLGFNLFIIKEKKRPA